MSSIQFSLVFILVCIFATIGNWAVSARPQEELPTSLIGFARIIYCTTHRFPLDYNNYGCYCGWGGAGTPVDAIDGCCKVHDECYGKCENKGCYPKLSLYDFTCQSKSVICSSKEHFFDYCTDALCCKFPQFLAENTECQQCACECDQQAGHCFRDNDNSYQNGKAQCNS